MEKSFLYPFSKLSHSTNRTFHPNLYANEVYQKAWNTGVPSKVPKIVYYQSSIDFMGRGFYQRFYIKLNFFLIRTNKIKTQIYFQGITSAVGHKAAALLLPALAANLLAFSAFILIWWKGMKVKKVRFQSTHYHQAKSTVNYRNSLFIGSN